VRHHIVGTKVIHNGVAMQEIATGSCARIRLLIAALYKMFACLLKFPHLLFSLLIHFLAYALL